MAKKYFIVADVHGFYNLLRKTLEDKGFELNNPEHYLICCGDLLDRGCEAKALLEFVQSLKDRFIYIRGNHEDLLNECVNEIAEHQLISGYHFTNGTVGTISQLTGTDEYDFKLGIEDDTLRTEICSKMKCILDWIYSKSINYFELKDYIFVHGWIPYGVNPKCGYQPLKDWKDAPTYQWENARWENGMELWRLGVTIPGKTIVCGHFHCSWGWSNIDKDRKEFPLKNKPGWQKSFEPYIKEGIIALDACTAYSGLINCLVIEEE